MPGGGVGLDEYGVGPGSSRFRYTGQYWLGDDLHYFKARIYHARLGRFLQPDPIGYGDGMNMYAYVGGDPINRTDPSGLEDEPAPEENVAYVDGHVDRPHLSGWASLMGTSHSRGPLAPTDDLAAGPEDSCKSDLGSLLGATREVLDVAQTAADVATIGTAVTGVGVPVALAAKATSIGLEAATGVVNIADGFLNSNWGPLIDQAVGAPARLIPGGKLVQKGLKQANKGRVFRDARGRFTRAPYVRKEKSINEATEQGLQNGASTASHAAKCKNG